jgi:hypothetical protein
MATWIAGNWLDCPHNNQQQRFRHLIIIRNVCSNLVHWGEWSSNSLVSSIFSRQSIYDWELHRPEKSSAGKPFLPSKGGLTSASARNTKNASFSSSDIWKRDKWRKWQRSGKKWMRDLSFGLLICVVAAGESLFDAFLQVHSLNFG